MSILDQAKAHWALVRQGSVEVPEWGATVHFQRLTVEDQQRLAADLRRDPVATGVRLVMERALDSEGKRLFDSEPSTFNALMKDVSPQALERIVTAISSTPTEGQAAKN